MFGSLFRSSSSAKQVQHKSRQEPPRNQAANAKTSKFRDGPKGAAAPVHQKANSKPSKVRDKKRASSPAQDEPFDCQALIAGLEKALAKEQGGAHVDKAAKKDKAKTKSGTHVDKAARKDRAKTKGGISGVKAAKKATVEGDPSDPRESGAGKGKSWWAKKRAARKEALRRGEEVGPAPNSKADKRKKAQLKAQLKDSEGTAVDGKDGNDGKDGKTVACAIPKPNLSPRQQYKKNRWARLRAERKERKNKNKTGAAENATETSDGSAAANGAGKDGLIKAKTKDQQQQQGCREKSVKKQKDGASNAKNKNKQEEISREDPTTKHGNDQQQQEQQKFSQSLLSAVNAAGGSKSAKAAQKLQGSRFRWLNEMLYTSSGADAKKAFDEDPSLAVAYHEGFRAQCAKWPQNPLDDAIAWIRREVAKGSVIGDFGCGEARLALELGKHYKIHSFDLIAINERIEACNLANVPLPNGCLDVGVFCLALMGTDWLDFVREAHRCLKPGGLLHVAEVESRFESIDSVVNNIQNIGFRQVMYTPGSFFIKLRFVRTGLPERRAKVSPAVPAASQRGQKRKAKAGADQAAAGLKACKYRRR